MCQQYVSNVDVSSLGSFVKRRRTGDIRCIHIPTLAQKQFYEVHVSGARCAMECGKTPLSIACVRAHAFGK